MNVRIERDKRVAEIEIDWRLDHGQPFGAPLRVQRRHGSDTLDGECDLGAAAARGRPQARPCAALTRVPASRLRAARTHGEVGSAARLAALLRRLRHRRRRMVFDVAIQDLERPR